MSRDCRGIFHCLASRNRRNDADFIAVLQRRVLVLQKADVLFVDVNVHKAAHFAFVIDEPFLDAGKLALQFRDRFADGFGIDLHEFLFVREFPKRSWNANFDCHNSVISFQCSVSTK